MNSIRSFVLGVALTMLATAGIAYATVKAVRYDFREGISVGKATGTGDLITAVIVEGVTIDFAAPGANEQAVATATVTGAKLGDVCIVSPAADDAAFDNGSLFCFVESADTVKAGYMSDATTAQDPASGTFNITLIRF